jgi:hypothetical protein
MKHKHEINGKKFEQLFTVGLTVIFVLKKIFLRVKFTQMLGVILHF